MYKRQVVENPTNLPDPSTIEHMEEPMAKVSVMTPDEYVGAVMDICQEKRGIFKNMEYIETTRVVLHYEIPLNEIIYDFFDQLKSLSLIHIWYFSGCVLIFISSRQVSHISKKVSLFLVSSKEAEMVA